MSRKTKIRSPQAKSLRNGAFKQRVIPNKKKNVRFDDDFVETYKAGFASFEDEPEHCWRGIGDE